MTKLGALCLCLCPVAAQAGTAWDMFVARCLDPFEHQTLPVISGLDAHPIDQMHEARRVYGPTDEGYLLVVDAAPSEGDRACAIEVPGEERTQAELAWRYDQLSSGRYAPEGSWLVSNEWIEPRVKVRTQVTDVRTSYSVVETDLES
ncbi:hypothetical protein [uncultured Tateyamaria sp.]|uniref:hypothetical protein n=2 Tax=uncultured Tateyamaria sp. TaxID=455651 RepID=UPI00261FAE1A|nr:hypothetical protein [uncultured Tateyamaria sp.]